MIWLMATTLPSSPVSCIASFSHFQRAVSGSSTLITHAKTPPVWSPKHSVPTNVYFSPQYKADTLKVAQTGQDLKEEHPWVDYTAPSLITLLFTDLGVLTPSAVSDELIKLYL